jgi:predicted nucleic acid-binding protein
LKDYIRNRRKRQNGQTGWREATRSLPIFWYKEFSRDQAEEMLALITEFDFAVRVPDAAQVQRAFEWTLRRAAACDSFYLALAETTSDGLWTADERLYNATKSLVPWVHWAGDPTRD